MNSEELFYYEVTSFANEGRASCIILAASEDEARQFAEDGAHECGRGDLVGTFSEVEVLKPFSPEKGIIARFEE